MSGPRHGSVDKFLISLADRRHTGVKVALLLAGVFAAGICAGMWMR